MKKKFSEEQIVRILNEFKNWKSAKDLSREYGVQPNTIYTWKGDLVTCQNKSYINLVHWKMKILNLKDL